MLKINTKSYKLYLFLFSGASLFAFLFKIKILMLISILEFRVLSEKFIPLNDSRCTSTLAFHRGYSLGGTYPENSMASLSKAVVDNVKRVEIDISIVNDQVFVTHDLHTQNFPLEKFLSVFENKFELLIVDIKGVGSYTSKTFELLKTIPRHFPKVIFLGRKCDLIWDLHQSGEKVSCEALGLLAHKLLGLDYWSVDYSILGEKYQSLLKDNPIKLLTWSWTSASDHQKLCSLSPDIILIDLIN